MSDSGTEAASPAPASIAAVTLLGELIRRGVRDIVVCPGSRSQALALAAAAAERAGAVRLHVRIDERSAGFFALGVARETGAPAPVIVTSGTAAANLAPAVMEAHEGRVPMLLLTADRPEELLGTRSNQTTRQAGLFGDFARLSIEAPAPELGDDGDLVRPPGLGLESLAATALSATTGFFGELPPGPVQLNLPFREPLSGTQGFDDMIDRGFRAAGGEADELRGSGSRGLLSSDASQTGNGFRTHLGFSDAETYAHRGDALAVVIAGADAGEEAEAFAHAAGLPLLAEVVSGSRYGRESVTAYATLIDDPSTGALVEQAIVFGHPTLTRQVPALLHRDDVEVVVVDPFGGAGVDHFLPTPDARVVREARVAEDHDPRALRRWLGAWITADRELRAERSTLHEPDLDAAVAPGYRERSAYARAEVAAMREPVSRELLVESVWRATWPHDRLVLAASRLVRTLDRLAPPRKLRVHANRGLSGIDGTIATALGIAATSQAHDDVAQAAGTTRAVLGDLALLHDAGSLLLVGDEPAPRIQLFVGNDGGGTIFDGLEVAGTSDRADFDRVMFTPQQVDIAQLAAAYGWTYQRVQTRSELERLLTQPVVGPSIVEVPLSR